MLFGLSSLAGLERLLIFKLNAAASSRSTLSKSPRCGAAFRGGLSGDGAATEHLKQSNIYIYMDFRPLDLKLLRMPAHMGFRPSPWCSWHLRKHLNGAKNHICEAVAGAHQLQGNQRESRFDELDEILHSHGPMLNCLVGRANACAHVLFGLRSGTHTWQHNELR